MSNEKALNELEAQGKISRVKTFGDAPQASGLDHNDPRVKRIAEALAYATPQGDEIRARREAERDARIERYIRVVDAAHQHYGALRAVCAIAMPYTESDSNGNDRGFEFLNRGDLCNLLELIMRPLEDALKAGVDCHE